MLLRNLISRNLHLLVLVTKKRVPLTRIPVAGRVKAIGKRTGEKLMLEKSNQLFLLWILTGILKCTSAVIFTCVNCFTYHVLKQ